ncbi:MAG: NAD-dependent epimerase/dehydratase family protein [Euryarchaeota archaeon]|nr:NAD-dependent epimerase/dehydratase family protein [Euryarchaeota archaeon]
MILITGTSGQVGSYLKEEFNNSVGMDWRASKYTEIVKDIREDFEPLLKNYEIEGIIHCAAQVSVVKSVEDPKEDSTHNILGTINLLEYARKHDIEQFIYISSAAIYGQPAYLPIDEEHPKNPESPYGLSKLTGERYALLYGKLYGIKVASIRPFNIFSPRQDPKNPYSGVISIFVDRAKHGQPLVIDGDGTQTRDFVNVHDVVQLIKLVMTKKATGAYNCGTGKETSINALAEIIREISGKKVEIKHGPPRPGDIKRSYASIEKVGALGFEPRTNLKEDLRRFFFS